MTVPMALGIQWLFGTMPSLLHIRISVNIYSWVLSKMAGWVAPSSVFLFGVVGTLSRLGACLK